ncbi:roadblock/LC7 domain-containing protein [Hydrogenophaga sp. 5NK40-0174]|uniref:roadblock/LC7 domain-containing protein n=1 Tax=Hydrogenophaga sp. 5NK40-0174 TaxID=3127649 RepID=UPI00310BDA41
MSDSSDKDPRASKVRSCLRMLHATLSEVEASAVVTRDGITIASLLGDAADKDRFGAMCASLLALADRAGKEVERGRLRQVILDGTKGPMLLTQASDATVLAVAADPNANLGRLILETRKIAAELKKRLDSVDE